MEQLKILVNYEIKNKRNILNSDCKTIDDIVLEHYGKEKYRSKYKDENSFRNWVKTDKDFKKLCQDHKKYRGINQLLSKIDKDVDLAISIAYIFYRTFSVESDYRSFVDEDTFLTKCKHEEGLNEDQKKRIFFLCHNYEIYLASDGSMNDNGAAREIENDYKNEDMYTDKKYDVIIVDEVQDLTKAQIKCINALLKKGSPNLYVFGDDNQTINPTMMDMNDVRQFIGECWGKKLNFAEDSIAIDYSEKPKPLIKTYRSSKHVVEYINYISKIRRCSIGRSDGYNEYPQEPVSDGTSEEESNYPAYILDVDNPTLSYRCLKEETIGRVLTTNNVMIIVPNEKTKDQLLVDKKFTHLEDNICTIEETKGREWDQVILYNFFSTAIKTWDEMTGNPDDEEGNATKIGRHSTIYRMYFNRLYVGITRARSKVIIIETEALTPKLKEIYFPSKSNSNEICLEQVHEESRFLEYFKNEYDHARWNNDAENLFEKEDYLGALDKQERAIKALNGDPNIDEVQKSKIRNGYEQTCERYRAYCRVKDFMNTEEIPREEADRYRLIFIKDNKLSFLKSFYELIGEIDKMHLLDISPETQFDSYLKLYKAIRGTFTEDEKNFFNSNVINAYNKKITSMLKGAN